VVRGIRKYAGDKKGGVAYQQPSMIVLL